MDKRRALGKGLESLLPQRVVKPAVAAVSIAAAEDVPAKASAEDVAAAAAQAALLAEQASVAAANAKAAGMGQPLEIALDRIEKNPFQTRTVFKDEPLQELADSIAVSGVVQPVTVRALADGRYQLITGERRWLASKIAGKATIPAVVREVSDAVAMEMTIVENLQRADLNPMEQARAFRRLSQEFKLTQEEMAQRTGVGRAAIANYLRLMRLPEDTQLHLESGALSFGHGKALLMLRDEGEMINATNKVLRDGLSVRQTELLALQWLTPKGERPAAKERPRQDPNVREAEDMLRRTLGLKVMIEDKGGKGKVVIEYAGVEDFDAIMAALGDRS